MNHICFNELHSLFGILKHQAKIPQVLNKIIVGLVLIILLYFFLFQRQESDSLAILHSIFLKMLVWYLMKKLAM